VTYSNVSIYKDIVNEAFTEMLSLKKESRVPKEDGSGGHIIKYDPDQRSFKHSMIVVAFMGMWLEAFFHHEMIKQHSKTQFHKHRKDSYREKLELIGINEPSILNKAKAFQKTRNDLIHEEAFLDKGVIKIAQDEAEQAHEIIEYVSRIKGDGGIKELKGTEALKVSGNVN